MMQDLQFRPGWAATAVTAACLAVLIALGTWQLQRLQWKERLIADIETAMAADPVPLSETEPAEFRKVTLAWQSISDRVIAFGTSAINGQLATRLLRTATDGNDRSWLILQGPVLEDDLAGPAGSKEPDNPLLGILRKPQPAGTFTPDNDPQANRFYSHDMDLLAQEFDQPLEPWVIHLDLTGQQLDLPNNHFTYALTWYGIAAALIGVYIAFGLARKEGST